MKLKIGLDFDGVIANTPELKREIAQTKFGINIPKDVMTKEGFLEKGFTEKTYKTLQEMVQSSVDVKPIPESIDYLIKWKKEGYYECIVSFREYRHESIIGNLLDKNGLKDIDYVMTNQKPKTWFCVGLDMFIDDRMEHLNDLLKDKRIPYLFLFDAPYNKNEKTNGIQRVAGLKEVDELIKQL